MKNGYKKRAKDQDTHNNVHTYQVDRDVDTVIYNKNNTTHMQHIHNNLSYIWVPGAVTFGIYTSVYPKCIKLLQQRRTEQKSNLTYAYR